MTAPRNHLCPAAAACALSIFLGIAMVVSDSKAAELLFDINAGATPLGSSVSSMGLSARVAAITLFAMDDGKHGTELWRTDGTPQGTFLCKDVFPGSTGSDIYNLTELDGRAVFAANDGAHGTQLWVSDGTAAGTHIVADMSQQRTRSPWFQSGLSFPRIRNAILFGVSSDDANLPSQTELWRSDGTSAGTWLVKTFSSQPSAAPPIDFTVVGDHLFFAANEAASGTELWVTDGTPTGTHMVQDIAPGGASSNPSELTAMNSGLLFAADDQTHGSELWKADSAGSSATLVADSVSGAKGLAPQHLVTLGNVVIFAGVDSPGLPSNSIGINVGQPYRSDGTAAGTYRLRDVSPAFAPDFLTRVGNRVVFHVQNPASSQSSLWGTDGTTAGTVPLVDNASFNAEGVLLSDAARFGNELVFFARHGAPGSDLALWRTDGSPAGTRIFASLDQPLNTTLVLGVLGEYLYYFSGPCCGTANMYLWRSNGTAMGTSQVSNVRAGPFGSLFQPMFTSNGRIYFNADSTGKGSELWASDGTDDGTYPLGDFNKRVLTASSDVQPFASVGSKALFIANDGVHGNELWVTGGTAATTQLLADINSTSNASSQPGYLGKLGNVAVFAANDGLTGNELWRSDGTIAGTYQIADIRPGDEPRTCEPRLYCPPVDPTPANSDPRDAVLFNGYLYFTANDGVHGRELWRTDGTTTGTTMASEVKPGADSLFISPLAATGNYLYLCVKDVTTQRLWITNGSQAGTAPVATSIECVDDGLRRAVSYHGLLYFAGSSANSDIELWSSDGAGAVRVLDLSPGASSSDPSQLAVVGDRIVFGACESADCGFYTSDGSAAGTSRVPTIPAPSSPIVIAGSQGFFTAPISESTQGAFVTDGTAAGTNAFLPAGSSPYSMDASTIASYQGKWVFAATNTATGGEVWLSNGTPGGTRLLADIHAGPADSSPFGFAVVGDTLVFGADDGDHGRELWTIQDGAPTANDDSVTSAFSTAPVIDVLRNDGFIAANVDQSSVEITVAPTSGTTAVNTSTGEISYQPGANFSGMDEFSYWVKDSNGRVSNHALVHVIVAPAAGDAPGATPQTSPNPPPSSAPEVSPESSGGGGEMSVVLITILFFLIVFADKRTRRSLAV